MMKTSCLLGLIIALFGCSSRPPQMATLTPEQATELAQKLANEKTQAVYQCRPFSNRRSAQLVDGLWVWQDRQGVGLADIEATVKFGSGGANPKVKVVMLHGRNEPLMRRLP